MRIIDAALWRIGLVRRSRYRHLELCYRDAWSWWQIACNRLAEAIAKEVNRDAESADP